MSLIALILWLVILGVGLWALNRFVTFIDPNIKKIINVVVVIAAILLVLWAFGVMDALNVRVPRLS
jgi:hypothetical protein